MDKGMLVMLEKASERLTNHLISSGVIKSEDYEIYQFGIEHTMLKLIHLMSYVALGLIFGKIPELIIFLIAFIPLREYSGGFHAKTPLRCYLVSCLTVVSILLLFTFAINYLIPFNIIIALVGSIGLFFVIPVEAKEKPLDEEEKVYYKKKGRIILLIELLLVIIFKILQWNLVSLIVALSIFYEMFIVYAGKLKK